MGETNRSPVQLAPPGAGIPRIQRLVGRFVFLPLYGLRYDVPAAIEAYREEGERLLAVCRSLPAASRTRRILLPRRIGLEDDSRFWSLAMVAHHLWIAGTLGRDMFLRMQVGESLDQEFTIVSLKPDPEVGNDVFSAFEEFLAGYGKGLAPDGTGSAPHPWFGRLKLAEWHRFALMHQRMHRKQGEAIARKLVRA